jgi:hypothetical protein
MMEDNINGTAKKDMAEVAKTKDKLILASLENLVERVSKLSL